MRKGKLFVANSRLVLIVVISPLSIPYVINGMLKKEKLTVREKIVFFSLLTIYIGSCYVTNLAGCSAAKVFEAAFTCFLVGGLAQEFYEAIGSHRDCQERDEN
ncbi:MAG: hypothetical protein WC536_02595 [Patescibacteria group bacterium]